MKDMAAPKINLAPNESIILKEACVAHGGVMAIYTDELILTNLNLICISKGMFGNTKKVYYYPLSQLKQYNGKAQVIMGKLSNGLETLELYFVNGTESFNFQSHNKRTINRWIEEISNVVGCKAAGFHSLNNEDDDEDDSDTLAGVINEFKEAGNEILNAFGVAAGVIAEREVAAAYADAHIAESIAFGRREGFFKKFGSVGRVHLQQVHGSGAGDGSPETVDFLVGLVGFKVNRTGRHIVALGECYARGGQVLAAGGGGGEHAHISVDPNGQLGIRLVGDFNVAAVVAGRVDQHHAAEQGAYKLFIDNIECIHNYIGVLKMINNRGSAADWSSGRWLPAG